MAEFTPINWKHALLRENPFLEVPPTKPEDVVWAGMKRLRTQFEELFTEALSSPPTQVVLNWGAYGSGKTHAAKYFGESERFPKIKNEGVGRRFMLYVRTPKDPSKADTILYRDLIEAIQFGVIRNSIREIIAELGNDKSLKALQDLLASEALGRALWLLGHEPDEAGQLQLFDSKAQPNDWHRKLEAYFFSQQTKTDLRALGLSRGIDTSQDRFRVLGGILQCLAGLSDKSGIEGHSRVFLWMDEIEDLLYFTSRQYRPFTQGLRDLIDRLPNYLSLLMNFTLASPEAYEDATVVLGEALMDRVTHQIYFREPNEKEALEYAVDLLKQYRTEPPESKDLPPTYPFEVECLKAVISMLDERTPREINKRLREIASKALMRRQITARKRHPISLDFVKQLDDERMDLELD